jgi:predicted RNase H-like HicB family nuclease
LVALNDEVTGCGAASQKSRVEKMETSAPRVDPFRGVPYSRATKTGKKTQSFTAIIYPDANSDWLVAHNPETGTTTQGKTFEEALANLQEATKLYLSEFPQATKGRAILTTFELLSPVHV